MKAISSNTAAKLLEAVTELKDASVGYYSLHFNLSKLREIYRSPYQIKIAVNIVSDLFKGQKGSIFIFTDCDLSIIYQGTDRGLLEKVIFQLRYLFMDDPLAYSDDGFENEDFCSVFDLEFQWRDFHNFCAFKAGGSDAKEPSQVKTSSLESSLGHSEKFHILTPEYLVTVIKQLANISIDASIRRQPVCAMIKDGDIRPVFKETYINISHLQKLLSVDVDLLSSATLFKYLTESLDKKMLSYITKGGVDIVAQPLSLNVNVKTLLTEDFASLDKILSPKQKASVVLEIAVSDVFEDTHQFIIARDAVQKLGYRICLDGLDDITLPQVDRRELGFDMAKLQWDSEMVKADSERKSRLANAVKTCGANRIVLCRCDDQIAVDFGRSLGVSLFQGRHFDHLLDPESQIIN